VGVILGLCSALVWGSGDFCGGRAATRHDPFQVLGLAAVAGMVVLGTAALGVGEAVPPGSALLWAAAAGVSGALGIVALYRGLAVGRSATVAPLAAVVAATCPVLYEVAIEGLPRPIQLGGFLLALGGIWLVSQSASHAPASRAGVRLGLLAGLGFGGFLIFIAQTPHGSVFVPLLIARAMMLATAVVVLGTRRTALLPTRPAPIAFLAGVLDSGGNVLYVLAQQHVRLDIAAVLSSLYPVATVVLARVILHERVSGSQWVGAAVCLSAIVLITA